MRRGGICCTWRRVYYLLLLPPRKRLRTRKSGCDPLTDFLLISPASFFPLSCPRRRFSPVTLFFLPRFLLFFLSSFSFFRDISHLKAENWSELALAREINSPFVSVRNSSFIIAVFLLVFSARFFSFLVYLFFLSLFLCILLVPVDSKAIKGGN